MHLIVSFAAPLAEAGPAALPAPVTPALDRLLGRWAEARRDSGDEDTLSMPHERALAAALGWTAADGCLPWAARAAAADGIAVGDACWGLLTPAHWRVGSDGVHLADPDALALSAADSRTLFDAVQPLLASDGYTAVWAGTLQWYVAHPSLRGLACASLDRAIGRNIDRWMPRPANAKPLRRLQNEIQMLLHGQPLNEQREAAGEMPVNSFWLSGCGPAQTEARQAVRLDQRLRGPALHEDWAAWREAWHALDVHAIAPLLDAAARGEPVRLTLCGQRNAVEFAPRRRAWWQRAAGSIWPARVKASAVREWL